MRDRRIKIAYITEEILAETLSGMSRNEVYVIAGIKGMPETVRVERVWHCPERMALAVALYDESFEVIPCGMPFPVFDETDFRTLQPKKMRLVEVEEPLLEPVGRG